ncbi:hypothetical protein ANOM_010512 [Aspergillus nomiae NRRL 13137]|uniref:Uncharacterized protein n=1 Tax=Aspergillus nomiae NRRL (strain ATCC 15546 / NRRL 13137 / CBS 260.88 / M93) TaxID=1509407 RepID=A0A0L1IPI5_ASPN3|nr:uncharacterized protein ANOM_010512 [Aspergillus nomiae NRRL 13137]KNG81404.1 hypothetical protein ANOM_010512 [Aspergillus nomiae NRRL 13137]
MSRGSSPYFCAFSPDSQLIASVTNRGEVQIWNATTGKMQHVFRESESCVYAVAFSPTTAGLLVTTNGSKVNIQDMTAGRLKATLDPMLGCTVQGVTFSADGTKLVAAIGNHVGIWDVPSFERTLIPAGFEITPVRYVQFGTNSNFLLSLSNSRVTVWTMEDGRNVRKADLDENSQINATSLSPNGMYVALAIHSRLRIRNTGQSNAGGEMSLEWNGEEITSLAFSPDGTLLTVAMLIGDFKILQHPWTDDPVQTLRGHDSLVSQLSFSASGHYLVSREMSETSRIWNVGHNSPNHEAGHLDAITCIELSSDGRYLVSASHDGSLCLWDGNQGTFKCKKGDDNSIAFTIQFSGDGNRLVTGAHDGVVRLWDIFNSTLTCTHRFAEHSKSVRARGE